MNRSLVVLASILIAGCSDSTAPAKPKPPVVVDPEFAKMMEKGGAGGGGSCSRPNSSPECGYKFVTAVDNFRRALQGGVSWEQFADSYRDYVNTPDGPGFHEEQGCCAPFNYGPMLPGYEGRQ